MIEGQIPPEMRVEGRMYVEAYRDSWLCKHSLWQMPTANAERIEASTQRSGNHYRLVFDFSDAPNGGFCKWTPDAVFVHVGWRENPASSVLVASLYPSGSQNALFDPYVTKPMEAPFEITCGGTATSKQDPDCDYKKRQLGELPLSGPVRLDVTYERSYHRSSDQE